MTTGQVQVFSLDSLVVVAVSVDVAVSFFSPEEFGVPVSLSIDVDSVGGGVAVAVVDSLLCEEDCS